MIPLESSAQEPDQSVHRRRGADAPRRGSYQQPGQSSGRFRRYSRGVRSGLSDAVLPLIRTRADLHRWSAANAHGAQLHDAVAILEAAAETEDPRVVLAMTQQAIASALKVVMQKASNRAKRNGHPSSAPAGSARSSRRSVVPDIPDDFVVASGSTSAKQVDRGVGATSPRTTSGGKRSSPQGVRKSFVGHQCQPTLPTVFVQVTCEYHPAARTTTSPRACGRPDARTVRLLLGGK